MTYAQYLAAKLAAEKEENPYEVTVSNGKRKIPYAKSFAALSGALAGLTPGIAAGGTIGGVIGKGSPKATVVGGTLGGTLGAVIASLIAYKAVKESYSAISPYEIV